MQVLIQKIEISLNLIRNSKELAGKYKKDKVDSGQTAIYLSQGLKVMKNYEVVLSKVEHIMNIELMRYKHPQNDV